MSELSTDIETRQRLLSAAGEVFAEMGFGGATIREIARRANANVAAVNYHFGDKMELYLSVFRHANELMLAKYPSILPGADATPQDRLSVFISAFVHKLFDPGRPSWHVQLMAREMIEPTGAMPFIVENAIRPQMRILESIIRDMIGPISDRKLARCCASVVGQILFYHHSRPVLDLLSPHHQNIAAQVEDVADHITRFCLGGLMAVRESAQAEPAQSEEQPSKMQPKELP